MATAAHVWAAWTRVDSRNVPAAERRAARVGVLLVVAFLGLPLFHGLRDTDLDNDEAIYSHCVDRVLETGHWLTLEGPYHQRFLEKPPLKIWIVAAGIRSGLLPHDVFGLRFWDASCGCAVFAYVFLLGFRLDGWICGAGASSCLFFYRPLLVDHGLRSNTMDGLLLLAYVAGMFHFLRWTEETERRRAPGHALAVGLWVAVAVLDKWVAAVFLPVTLVAAAAVDAGWRALAWRERRTWAATVALAGIVVSPWFVYETVLFGADFWRISTWTHVVRRFTDGLDPAHLQPWTYYLGRLWADGRDFRIVAILGALLWHRRTIATRWAPGILVSLWLVLPLTALTLGRSKLGHYLYPFVPPLALWAGYGVARTLRAAARAVRGPATSPARVPRPALAILWSVAAGSAALLLATWLSGPVHATVFGLAVSNSTLWRPLAVAVLSGVAAGGGPRLVPAALAAASLACVAPPYREALRPLVVQDHRVSRFAACLERADRARHATFYLLWPSGRVVRNDVYYYLRGVRLETPRLKRNGLHRVPLRRQPRNTVFVVALDELPALSRRPGWHAIEATRQPVDLFDGRFFLPAAYATCASVLEPDRELLHAPVERRAAEPERFGGALHVAVRHLQRLRDLLPLDPRQELGQRAAGGSGRAADQRSEPPGVEQVPVGEEQDGAGHLLLELADVARPVAGDESVQGRPRDALGSDLVARRRPHQEVGGEIGDVLASAAERRHLRHPGCDPVVEVLAESAVCPQRVHVAIGRRHHADRGLSRRAAADAVDLTLLEHAQDPGLGLEGHVADLVEEQRPGVGQLEFPGPRLHPRGHAALDPEQLGLEQVPRQCGAVQRDERAAALA